MLSMFMNAAIRATGQQTVRTMAPELFKHGPIPTFCAQQAVTHLGANAVLAANPSVFPVAASLYLAGQALWLGYNLVQGMQSAYEGYQKGQQEKKRTEMTYLKGLMIENTKYDNRGRDSYTFEMNGEVKKPTAKK